MKNKNSKGFSLVEITIALFILAIAVIPLIGTITSDARNAIALDNAELATQRARYVLDTLLDSVDFDDLGIGAPAVLKDKSKVNFYTSMFPEGDGESCQGYYTDGKGQRFFLSLEVYDLPNEILSFSCYKNPDLIHLFTNATNGVKTQAEKAEETERGGKPSYSDINRSVYANSDWGKHSETFHSQDFLQNLGNNSLMKCLILNVKWNDSDKANPESAGFREFYLVTHKARLTK